MLECTYTVQREMGCAIIAKFYTHHHCMWKKHRIFLMGKKWQFYRNGKWKSRSGKWKSRNWKMEKKTVMERKTKPKWSHSSVQCFKQIWKVGKVGKVGRVCKVGTFQIC
jgi:hypothetical protein